MNESVLFLPRVGSTNAWAKEHLDVFGPIGAVYTTNQTAGRGRLGRAWADAPGQALFCTVVLKTPLAQPATLPLFASLAVADTLHARYGVQCRIKWPNDLLLNGKKIALFGSYGWGDGEWMRSWEAVAKGFGAELACGSVICADAPDEEAQAACEALGKALA